MRRPVSSLPSWIGLCAVSVLLTVAAITVLPRMVAPSVSPPLAAPTVTTTERDGIVPSPATVPLSASPSSDAVVHVTLKGGIVKPGAYAVAAGTTLAEAIIQAGGPTPKAALQGIDLKQVVKDSSTFIVPENVSAPLPLSPGAAASKTSGASVPPPTQSVFDVTVEGAVAKPGTYRATAGQRLSSVLIFAGGPLPTANLKVLNLNQPVHAGMRINVPSSAVPPALDEDHDDAPPSSSPTPPQTINNSSSAASPPETVASGTENIPSLEHSQTVSTTPININTATRQQLQTIPGIGPTLASRILLYRNVIGSFHSPEQLMDVKGISPDSFKKIQPFVSTQ